MARVDEIRLITKVARLYYDQGIRQQEITKRLNIHQSTVSRLLKRARAESIVRITVLEPEGVFSALEEGLEQRFGLGQAIIVEGSEQEEALVRDLGSAAAFFLESMVKPGMVIGISSWSRALLSMVDSLHQTASGKGGKVVQVLGGIGNATTQYQATFLAQRLAERLGAMPVMLQAPGVVSSAEARRILSRDVAFREAAELFPRIDLALVGIGAIEPSPLLASSGNVFSPAERVALREAGAVGDICLRFFDRDGELVRSPLHNRVVGIEPAVLRKAPTVVGIAGGAHKVEAILAVLRGRWIDALITDRRTAEAILRAPCDGSVLSHARARMPKGAKSKV